MAEWSKEVEMVENALAMIEPIKEGDIPLLYWVKIKAAREYLSTVANDLK